MTLYPVFLKLEHHKILIVGGGEIAEQKLEGILRSATDVTVIAPHLNDRIARWATEGRLRHVAQEYQAGMAQDNHSLPLTRLPSITRCTKMASAVALCAMPWTILPIVDFLRFRTRQPWRFPDCHLHRRTQPRARSTCAQKTRSRIRAGELDHLAGTNAHRFAWRAPAHPTP